MLSNLHTHTIFCDGKNTPEEVVLAAIEKGFSSIGFSGHGYTPFDLSYCIKDIDGYMSEIKRLREKYKKDIEVYLGVEEDAFHPACRENFDYIIGSSHYYLVDGEYYPIDSDFEGFKKCLSLFEGNPVRMAHAYYKPFCEYVNKRKPDIVGHFDLITKYDELEKSIFLEDKAYLKTAEEYIENASRSGCLFEVNTGAIARGLRTSPYPYENLLRVLKRAGNGIVLSADSHETLTLAYNFDEVKAMLKDLGFTHTYMLYGGKFVECRL